MICFADTDILLKLASCDLLPPTLTVLGVTRQEVSVFREEAYRVYKYDAEVLRQYTQEARQCALRFINSVHGLFTEPDPEEQAYMVNAFIDSGEQIVFGATREYAEFQVITADRNALRALAHADGCGGICNRMQGRVISLEQILLRLILHLGFEIVQEHVLPCAKHDAAFSLPFAAGKTQVEAETELRTRIEILRAQTRDLLVL